MQPGHCRPGTACIPQVRTIAIRQRSRVHCDRWKGGKMASEGEVWVQLATRIPKQLHRELKLYCVKSDVSVMDFVVSALEDKLQRETRSGGARKRARA